MNEGGRTGGNVRMKPVMLLWLGLGVATSLAASEGFERVWSGRFMLPPGGRLAVENVQGDILVEGWDRAEVEVSVVKKSLDSSSHLDKVRIAVEYGDRALTFRTLYPEDLDEPIRVDYRLVVPRQVCLNRLSTLEGNITVREVEGTVNARSLRGDIQQLNVAGSVAARTLAGNIAVSLRSMPEAPAAVVLEAISGNVDLVLPPGPNADLVVSTVAGRLEGNYIFEASSVPGDTSRRARLGKGGVRVSMRTIRGDIRVAEREDQL